MTAATVLNVTSRELIGKANRRLGKDAVPAIVYGQNREPLPVTIDRHELELFSARHGAGTTIVDLTIDGGKKPVHVMIREVQRSPIKGSVLHVDFMAVDLDKLVQTTVPLTMVNDPEGVKAGGVLFVSLHEVNVEAKPGDLPSDIEVDISGLGLNHSLFVSDVVAPAGVTILDDPTEAIATVQPPRAEEEETSAEEAAEPEVIGKAAEKE